MRLSLAVRFWFRLGTAVTLVAGSLMLHGRTVRRMLPVVERLTYLSKLPRKLLRPPKRVPETAPRAEENRTSR